MPRIPRPRSSPTLPTPFATPEMFGAAEGRAVENLGQTVSQIGDMVTQRKVQSEITKLSSEFARAQAELTTEWQRTLRTADPTDTEVASRFQQEVVQARLQELSGLASTREAQMQYQRMAGAFSANFMQTTAQGQMRLDTVNALEQFNTTVNQLGDVVTADPSQLGAAMMSAEIALDGFRAAYGIDPERYGQMLAETRNGIAMTGARAAIDADPARGRAMVEAGAFSEFISGDEKMRLIEYADRLGSAQNAAATAATKNAAKQARFDLQRRAYLPNGQINKEALPALVAEAANNPVFATAPAEQAAVLNMLNRMAKDDKGDTMRTDGEVYMGLLNRATLPLNDPNRLTEKEVYRMVGRGLSATDASRLTGVISDGGGQVEKSFYTAMRTFITGQTSPTQIIKDVTAEARFSQYKTDAAVLVDRLREEGRSEAEIFSTDGELAKMAERYLAPEGLSFRQQQAASRTLPAPPAPPDTDDDVPLTSMTPEQMQKWLENN